jgi:hypothetical protein
MIIAVAAWIISAAVCYLFMRRVIFNFGDPLLFVNISIPFSAALLSFLCASNLVSWDKFVLFSLVLLSFLAGGRIAAAFFGREGFRRAMIKSVSRLSRTEIYMILSLTTVITIVLAFLAVQAGAQGDARQDFTRAFRPLVTLHSGLWLFSLIALLSPKLSNTKVLIWFVLLVVPSIAFSGKAVLLPVFFWFGMRFFVNRKRANLTTVAVLTGTVFLGVGIMGLIAYGASSSADIFLLIAKRLWLSGDVYVYAYKQDALTMVRADYHVSFLSYMLHPITSLIGIRGYEKPLGSMLASEVLRSDVLVGPNPHLPVLLDYFFPNQMVVTILISIFIGALVIGVRAVGIHLADTRSRYLGLGGITAAVFCPAGGFQDTSQVLIALVGIAAVTACGVVFELFVRRGPRRQSVASNALPNEYG